MDITSFVVASRDKALLYGDYGTYRTLLAHRLLNVRKRLRVATKHRGKYSHKSSIVTAEQVAEDVSYARLLLLSAERAYAQAMAMKAAHASNKKGITGRTRSHIVSRLDKAAKYAESLLAVLQDDASGARPADRLEAHAYAAFLRGAAFFEKQSWQPCLVSYAAVWAIYRALASASPVHADLTRDLLADTLEPSLRYAAYQLKMPRSKPIPIIAREALAADGSPASASLVARINEIDPAVLQPTTASDDTTASASEVVVASTRTLTWRSREVRIEDAAIASAWAALDRAKARLEAQLVAAGARMAPKDMAAAYDDVLTVSQDAVDATKAAIDDLRAEGLPQSHPSIQTLYMARTAAHYEMISSRIGRNRVLTGAHDGADAHLDASRKTKKTRASAKKAALPRPEAPGRFLARLKEKVVLYDGTIQSLDAVKELPGVAADEALSVELDATAQYFSALKALAIARSYSVAGSPERALALVKHAHDQCAAAAPVLQAADPSASASDSSSPLRSIHVSAADVQFLQALLQTELQRSRALVDVETLQKAARGTSSLSSSLPLSTTLATYPRGPVDLDNVVAYPPRIEPVPVKPIFLDIAWNYIEYPSKSAAAKQQAAAAAAKTAAPQGKETAQPQKRGWFGFGR